jgi:hypothetical protein
MTDRTLATLCLAAASLVLFATVVFLRNSPWLFIPAALLPLIFVVLIARRPVTGRMDYRFGMALAIAALVVGAMRTEIVDVDGNRMVAMIAALAALSFLCVLAVPTLRRRRRNLFVIGIMAVVYSYGSLVYANSVFDRSEPRHHVVRILQIAERGRGLRRWALVSIEPWGPESAARGFRGPEGLVDDTKPGNSVCIVARDGALGVRWFRFESCGSPAFADPDRQGRRRAPDQPATTTVWMTLSFSNTTTKVG